MFGFFIGALVLFGVTRFARHRRRCHARHGGHHRGWRGRRQHERDRIEYLAERLDLDDTQEDILREQARLFRKRLRSMRDEVKKTRVDLANAVRGPSFDETIMGEMYARHDDAIRLLRLEAVERLASVHAALDDRQRERLADILEAGAGGGGPFRAGW